MRKRPKQYDAGTGRYFFTSTVSRHDDHQKQPHQDLEFYDDDNPTLKQALNSKEWIKACMKEWQQMLETKAVKLIELEKGRKVVGNKIVLKKKYSADGKFIKHKARWVIKGFTQIPGQDFFETFAPVSAANMVRLFFAIVAQRLMYMLGYDVSTAYLNSDLLERVQTGLPPEWKLYLSKPELDFITTLNNPGILVLKSIYGLRQSGRNWYLDVKKTLFNEGFIATISDPCLFSKWKGNRLMLISVYVDDFNCAADTEEDVSSHLGMRISYDRGAGVLTLDQEEFTKRILKHFAPTGSSGNDWKPVETPLEVGGELGESKEEEQDFDHQLYQQASGSLAYLATRTRPDISVAWSVISRKNARPKISDWVRLKRIFRYLSGTKDLKLVYTRNEKLNWSESITGYCDASFGGSRSDRKSQSGFVFSLGNMAILWSSKKQPIIALSATEAEYICLAAGVQDGCWVVNILGEIGLVVNKMIVYEDNMGAIHIAQNSSSLGRVKHIDIRYHYIKQKVEEGTLLVKYCKTDHMVADVLTKGLAKQKFMYFRGLLGLTRSATIQH